MQNFISPKITLNISLYTAYKPVNVNQIYTKNTLTAAFSDGQFAKNENDSIQCHKRFDSVQPMVWYSIVEFNVPLDTL